jgi:hypothetical protein
MKVLYFVAAVREYHGPKARVSRVIPKDTQLNNLS